LTVVSPDGHDDIELSLEPNASPPARRFRKRCSSRASRSRLQVDDIAADFKRLKAQGVVFTQEPTAAGPVTIAVCADTCGNLIQLYQPPRSG
jgi:glyoxylase I family protein